MYACVKPFSLEEKWLKHDAVRRFISSVRAIFNEVCDINKIAFGKQQMSIFLAWANDHGKWSWCLQYQNNKKHLSSDSMSVFLSHQLHCFLASLYERIIT